MSSDEDQNDKQHDPTQKRLDDARAKGDIPRSQDVSTAAAYLGLVIAITITGGTAIGELGALLSGLIGQADQLAPLFFDSSAQPATGSLMIEGSTALLRILVPSALLVLLAILAQRGFVVAPDKIVPKMSRLSPLSNAKNKFGRNGLFEFSKSFTKLMVYGVLVWIFLLISLDEIIGLVHADPGMVVAGAARHVVSFLYLVLAIALMIAVVDYAWQFFEHQRRNRMSHQELRDEHKAQEGDPHMKQQRRQRGYEIAMNQMLSDVPDADVVIVNPEHYAVALRWDRASGRAPVCVAKGVDAIAARIREAASEAGVPLHRDPPTARALFAAVNIGDEVHPEHYRAVAVAIRFAETLRSRAKSSAYGR